MIKLFCDRCKEELPKIKKRKIWFDCHQTGGDTYWTLDKCGELVLCFDCFNKLKEWISAGVKG